jgi:hypothetical protein
VNICIDHKFRRSNSNSLRNLLTEQKNNSNNKGISKNMFLEIPKRQNIPTIQCTLLRHKLVLCGIADVITRVYRKAGFMRIVHASYYEFRRSKGLKACFPIGKQAALTENSSANSLKLVVQCDCTMCMRKSCYDLFDYYVCRYNQ